MPSCRYRVCTKRHVFLLVAVLFLLAILLVVAAAALPYVYANISTTHRQPIACTDRFDQVVSLTFDVTTGDAHIDALIDTLSAARVPAAFFVTGEWLDRYPASAQALHEAGFPLMNLTDSYAYLTDLSYNDAMQEFVRCGDKIQALTGQAPLLCRAPRGQYNDTVLRACDALGLTCVQWDVEGHDDTVSDPADLARLVSSSVSTGSIVRLRADAEVTAAALPDLLQAIQDRGFTVTPLTSLLYTDSYTINHEGRQQAL